MCGMLTSKAFKLHHGGYCSMLVKGSFRSLPQPPSFSSSPRVTDQPLFIALCTPTVNRLQSDDLRLCHSFSSVHRLDMSCTQASHRFGHMSTSTSTQDFLLHLVTRFMFLFLPVFCIFSGIQMTKWKADHGTVWFTRRIFAP